MSKKQKIVIGLVLAVFLIAAVVSVVLMGQVSINYNISDYLSEDTDTKAALRINQAEFGVTTDIQVMISDISREDADSVAEDLKDVENVLTVNFDGDSPDYFLDGNALFLILVDGDEYSETAATVVSDVKALLDETYSDSVHYGGTAVSRQEMKAAITSEMGIILVAAIALVIVILLIMAKSWLEPLVLLLASGIAVLLNLGTNAIFENISYITNSIAAILQLALSIDYSIVLLHTYRHLRSDQARDRRRESRYDTMLEAVRSVVKPVLASALTTIAGLLALLFMSFRIGFDMGIVLIKGITLSLVASLTLFPVLLLVFDGLMRKTKKKALSIKGGVFCDFAYRCGKFVIPVFLVLLVVGGIMQGNTKYDFTDNAGNENPIADVFGQNNSVVLVYGLNEDSDEQEAAFIDRLSQLKTADGEAVLKSATGYTTTALEVYDLAKGVETLGIPEEQVRLLYAMYAMEQENTEVSLTVQQFLEYSHELMENNATAQGFAEEGTAEMLSTILTVSDIMNSPNTAEDFCQKLSQSALTGVELDPAVVSQLYMLYFSTYGASADGTIVGRDFIETLISLVKYDDTYAAMIPETVLAGLNDMKVLDIMLQDEESYDAKTMASLVNAFAGGLQSVSVANISSDLISGIYTFYAADNDPDLIRPIAANELVAFITDCMDSEPLIRDSVSDENRQAAADAEELIARAEEMFRGENYGRLLLSLNLPTEGEDAERFMEEASVIIDETFTDEAYLAGNIPSTNDLMKAFDYDNVLITIITIVSIFLIVMVIFRSLSLPVVLVALIQGAIWLTLTALILCGKSIFFMSYIVSTCILMGATIDYGILMSSNYVVLRQSHNEKNALRRAVAATMPTVFTSGLTLIIAGFVISFISSQGSISAVGLLLGVGTVASVAFITLVLPSMLYHLDKFIMKFSMKTKI